MVPCRPLGVTQGLRTQTVQYASCPAASMSAGIPRRTKVCRDVIVVEILSISGLFPALRAWASFGLDARLKKSHAAPQSTLK